MSLIHLDAGKCIRSLSKDSQCNKCELICPTDAIVIAKNPLPSINFSSCVGCGACHGICPNEALGLDEFNSTDFFFDFIESKENLISCKKNIPCISALNIEHLISMAILKKKIIFDMGHCDTCEIAHTCKPQILKNYEETSYLLEAMENESEIILANICYEPDNNEAKSDRRGFLNRLSLSSIGKVKNKFEQEVAKATDELIEHTLKKDDIELLKKKHIPDKRKILYTAINRLEKPSKFHIIDANEISFTSQKLIDKDTCTACQMCYRICPTGSLSSDIKNSKIDFDPFLCIKCHACHEVCEPKALTLSNSYNIKEFFEPEIQTLIAFNVRKCDECNVIYSTNSKDKLCYRCKAEEEEARELWGIE